jgi:hypothetical protein
MLLLMLLCYYWCVCSFIVVDFWIAILDLDGPVAEFRAAAVVALLLLHLMLCCC